MIAKDTVAKPEDYVKDQHNKWFAGSVCYKVALKSQLWCVFAVFTHLKLCTFTSSAQSLEPALDDHQVKLCVYKNQLSVKIFGAYKENDLSRKQGGSYLARVKLRPYQLLMPLQFKLDQEPLTSR